MDAGKTVNLAAQSQLGPIPSAPTKTEERRVIASNPAYTISNLGVVRRGEKIIGRGKQTKWGYMQVHLRGVGCDGRQALVHRLVLEAFIGPCPHGHECRHLDGNPGNNRLDNLAWGTPTENGEDKFRHGRVRLGDDHPEVKVSDALVLELRARAGAGELAVALAAEYSLTRQLINGRCRGRLPGAIKRRSGRPRRGGREV